MPKFYPKTLVKTRIRPIDKMGIVLEPGEKFDAVSSIKSLNQKLIELFACGTLTTLYKVNEASGYTKFFWIEPVNLIQNRRTGFAMLVPMEFGNHDRFTVNNDIDFK
jgi:hypothetical protein